MSRYTKHYILTDKGRAYYRQHFRDNDIKSDIVVILAYHIRPVINWTRLYDQLSDYSRYLNIDIKTLLDDTLEELLDEGLIEETYTIGDIRQIVDIGKHKELIDKREELINVLNEYRGQIND